MSSSRSPLRVTVLLVALQAAVVSADAPERVPFGQTFRGALLTAREVTDARIAALRTEGTTSVVVLAQGGSPEAAARQREAASRIMASGLQLYYWIEVARCPELADAHPDWMASLQTHDQWRRHFPESPIAGPDEVSKTYPWVPILSREPFVAQLQRVKRLLNRLPEPAGVYLNDLQGAPSACGCGNSLCRWTSDYGNRRTTTPLDDDAATLFVAAVQKVVPRAEVIPVWTTECEQHDGAADGLCAGVGCFDGICWKAYTRQLMPLQQSSKRIAVLATYRQFQRDTARYGIEAGWVRDVVESFTTMLPERGGEAVAASRLITILQGWDVSDAQIAAQIQASKASGANGYVVSFTKLDQSWSPKVVRWR